MKLNTEGLVLSDQKLAGEKHLLTILTRNNGILNCFLRGGSNASKRFGAAVGLLCYSNFSLYEGAKSYTLDEAIPKMFFYDIMFDIRKLALAQYFCDLAIQVIPEGSGSPEYLSLMLNCLHLLSEGKRHELVIKAVFELRMMGLSGFMPDIVACRECGEYEDDRMYFDLDASCLWCSRCCRAENTAVLSKKSLNAVRTSLLAEPKKIFSFALEKQDIYDFAELAEKYTLKIADKSFTSLDYFKKIRISESELM